MAIYRPPDTSVSEWKMAVDALSEEIDMIQAHGAYQRVLIGGDINFKNLLWNIYGEMMIQGYLPSMETLHRSEFLFKAEFKCAVLISLLKT